MTTGKRIIIIPARLASHRFPGKPMAEVKPGVPLVRAVYDRAKQTAADHVIVATPDREVAQYCKDNGMVWRPTRPDHPTGTHRCAEVLRQFKEGVEVSTVVNWQCDEPMVPVDVVNKLLTSEPTITTLVGEDEWGLDSDPNVVKVVVSHISGRCHWFSRAPMAGAFCHCGVYAFDPCILEDLGRLKPTRYSMAESLEQLAWIEHGYVINGQMMGDLPFSVDTPADLEKLKRWIG